MATSLKIVQQNIQSTSSSSAQNNTSHPLLALFKVPTDGSSLTTWQSRMVAAIENFLGNIKQVIAEAVGTDHPLKVSPVVISYADDQSDLTVKTAADILRHCLEAVGITVTLSLLEDDKTLEEQLKNQTFALVLCTPLYAKKVEQFPDIKTTLDAFGKTRKNALQPLLCEGGFPDTALKIVDGHYLIRSYHKVFQAVSTEDRLSQLQTFVDLFLNISGNQGLGILPDVLDLKENENLQAEIAYKKHFNVLETHQRNLTIDYRLKIALEQSAEEHTLKDYLEANPFPLIDGLNKTGFTPVVEELLQSPAKVSLLLCPSKADTGLSSLALMKVLLSGTSSSIAPRRVLSIECADYPGKAAGDCVRLALQKMKLKTADLNAMKAEPITIIFRGYENIGAYDNLYVKNKLSTWMDVKVLVTCRADFFKFRGYLSCFLADVSNRQVDDILVHKVPSFAILDAQQTSLTLTHQPAVLDAADVALLSPKRRAELIELKAFLKALNEMWVKEEYLKPSIEQNPQIFISYAWEVDKAALSRQQGYLSLLSEAFSTLGFPTWLDIERMTGNINEQMAGNIANSESVFVIGTPRYTERSAQNTNVKKEFDAIVAKAATNTQFKVFPLQFSGDAQTTAFPATLQNHPNHCDFREIDIDYLQRITDPVHGLISKLLLDTSAKKELYQAAYATFQNQLKLLVGKHLVVNQAQDDVQGYDIDNRLKGYIEPFGLVTETSSLDSRFDLAKKFQVFLDNPICKTAVVLGRAGSGKSLFALSTFKSLLQSWHEYQNGSTALPTWLPVYIQLRQYAADPEHCVQNALRDQFHLEPADIEALRNGLGHQQRILFILDGYDELGSGVRPNLTQSLADWPTAKLLVTARPEHFDANNRPIDTLCLRTIEGQPNFQSIEVTYVSPFSPSDIQRYVAYHNKGKNEDTYQTLEKLPGMMALLDNPFLLTLVLQSLPQLLKNRASNKNDKAVTRTSIYQAFTETWFLQETKGRELNPKDCEQFSQELAFRFFKDKTISVSDIPEKKELSEFFNDESHQAVQDASPIRFSGGEYSFVHKSVYEYFVATRLWQALFQPDCVSLWQARPLTDERAIIDFLSELYQAAPQEARLFQLIEKSRDNTFPAMVSSNAITVLNAAQVSFACRDLNHVRIPGADLTRAMCESTNFSNADLSNVILEDAWLNHAQFTNTLMRSVSFKAWPSLSFNLNHHDRALNCVYSCVYSHDGQWLAIAVGGDIRLYTTKTREYVKTFKGNTNINVDFSWDGKLIASGTADSMVRLWSVENGELLNEFVGHTGEVTCVAFSPDGKLIASQGDDKTIRLWSLLEAGNVLRILPISRESTSISKNLAFSPDGKLIAVGNTMEDSKTVYLYSVENGEILRELTGHTESVISVAFSPDGKLVASGSIDKTIRLWSVENGRVLRKLTGHIQRVTSIAFSPNGKYIVSGSQDRSVRLWSIENGEILREFMGHTTYITSVAFNSDGKQIVSSESDCFSVINNGTVRFWSVENVETLRTFREHTKIITNVDANLDQNQILPSSDNVSEKLFDLMGELNKWITSVAVSLDGKLLVSGSYDDTVRIWSVENGKLLRTFIGHSHHITSVAFSPDGKFVVSGGYDKTVRLWSIGDNRLLQTLTGHSGDVDSVAFSSDGKFVVSGSSFGTGDNTMRLWSVESGEVLGEFMGHTNGTSSVAFSPDGKFVASGGYDKTVRFWSTESGKILRELTGHAAYITSVAFSLDGKLVVSGSADRTVRLWSAENGEVLQVFTEHTNVVTSVAFSPNGKLVVSGSNDVTLRLWSVITGEALWDFQMMSAITSISWQLNALGETCLAIGQQDGAVSVWRMPQQTLELRHTSTPVLIWRQGATLPAPLTAVDCSINRVIELSVDNVNLLKQHGAIGRPIMTAENYPDWNLLHLAAANNNKEQVSKLITEQPALLEGITADGSTPLHLAACYHNLEIIKYLLNHGANRLARNRDGNWPGQLAVKESYSKKILEFLPIEDKEEPKQTPLHLAVIGGYEQVIIWLLKQSKLKKIELDINAINHQGKQPLFFAIAEGKKEIAKILLNYGADINFTNEEGQTIAHFLVHGDQDYQIEALKLLKQYGANFLAKNNDGFMPLHSAADNGRVEMIEWLFQQGVSIESKTDEGATAVYIAAYAGQIKVLELLKRRGADLLSEDNDGWTPFHMSICHGRTEIVEWFLEQGVPIGLRNIDDFTGVHFAALFGRVAILSLFKKRGADLLARTNDGKTALHLAASKDEFEAVAWLLEQGIPIELRSNEGETATNIAARCGQLKTLKFLKGKGADLLAKKNNGFMPLHNAAYSGQIEVLEWFLNEGVSIELKNDSGETAAHVAARAGQLKTLKLLKERGADLLTKRNNGFMPLHDAAYNDKVEVVEWLLEQGISIELRNNEGETSVHVAAYMNRVEVLKLLKASGADLSAKESAVAFGGTSLHRAAAANSTKTLEWLLDERIFIDILRDDDCTPLHRAAYNGSNQAVELLVQRGAKIDVLNKDKKTPAQLARENKQEKTVILIEQLEEKQKKSFVEQAARSITTLQAVLNSETSTSSSEQTLSGAVVAFSVAGQSLETLQGNQSSSSNANSIVDQLQPTVANGSNFNKTLKMSKNNGQGEDSK